MRRRARSLAAGWTVKVYPKGLFTLAAFAGILLLAINTRAGNIHPTFLVVGVMAYLVIEGLVIFGPGLLANRLRQFFFTSRR